MEHASKQHFSIGSASVSASLISYPDSLQWQALIWKCKMKRTFTSQGASHHMILSQQQNPQLSQLFMICPKSQRFYHLSESFDFSLIYQFLKLRRNISSENMFRLLHQGPQLHKNHWDESGFHRTQDCQCACKDPSSVQRSIPQPWSRVCQYISPEWLGLPRKVTTEE